MVSFRFFGRDSSWTEFRVSRSKLAHTATNGTRSRWVALRWFLWILRDGIFARFSTDSLFFFFGHSDSSSLAYSHSFVVAFFPAWIPVFTSFRMHARVLHVYSSHTLATLAIIIADDDDQSWPTWIEWVTVRQRFIAHMQWNKSYQNSSPSFFFLFVFHECQTRHWPAPCDYIHVCTTARLLHDVELIFG